MASWSHTAVELRLRAPRHLSALHHLLEHLPVTQRIHGAPEPLIFVGDEPSILYQAIEGLEHQLFASAHVVEDLLAEEEISAVDPDLGFLVRTKSTHRPVTIEFRQMEIEWRTHRD